MATLKEFIDSRGIKHSFIAKQIGVNPATLSKFIKEGRGLGLQKRLKLKELLEKYKNVK